jgi:hypothetical protein
MKNMSAYHIVCRPPTDEYREGWERIFGNHKLDSREWCEARNINYYEWNGLPDPADDIDPEEYDHDE